MSVIFFHQNEVTGAQGGIERYLSTLLQQAGASGRLVAPAGSAAQRGDDQTPSGGSRIRVSLPLRFLPKWLGYVFGVVLASGAIRRAIKALAPCTLEFSRPEYAAFSWLFAGAKVFTIHGTGPARGEGPKYWIHRAACRALPVAADVVQIVGRDPSALPASALLRLSSRIRYLDAWYDDAFRVTPLRGVEGPLRVFYAGRLASMKNPELLFKIVETAHRNFPGCFDFRYFGADSDMIPSGLLRRILPSYGLLNAPQLAAAIADCHAGILCSSYGEGSPFVVVETLACGRGFVLPPLTGLVDSYRDHRGVMFTLDYSVDAFIEALTRLQAALRDGLTAEEVASDVAERSKDIAACRTLRRLEADHNHAAADHYR